MRTLAANFSLFYPELPSFENAIVNKAQNVDKKPTECPNRTDVLGERFNFSKLALRYSFRLHYSPLDGEASPNFAYIEEFQSAARATAKYSCTQFCGADNIVFEFRESSGAWRIFRQCCATRQSIARPLLLPPNRDSYFKINLAVIHHGRSSFPLGRLETRKRGRIPFPIVRKPQAICTSANKRVTSGLDCSNCLNLHRAGQIDNESQASLRN